MYFLVFAKKRHVLFSGVVTSTRITHASPGGLYSHIAHRDWECDSDRSFGVDCQDIASQLVHNSPGNKINVLLGGGLSKFKLEKAGKRVNVELYKYTIRMRQIVSHAYHKN